MTGKTVSFAFVLFKHPTQQAKIRIVHGKYTFEKCRDEKCLIHAKSRVMRREQGGGGTSHFQKRGRHKLVSAHPLLDRMF